MRTEMTLEMLVRNLQENCGDMLDACRRTGVSLIFVNQWRKDDPEIDRRLAEAERVGTQGLVSAAITRAVRGVEEDIYFKGEVVGQKRVYSDGLLQTLLKAKVPEFQKDGEGSGVTVNVNVANMMPRAESYDQWLEMKRVTTQPAIPAPDTAEVIEAEVVACNPFEGIAL